MSGTLRHGAPCGGHGHPDPGPRHLETGPPTRSRSADPSLAPASLTAPVTSRTRGAAARGAAPPAPEHPEDRSSPGAAGLCRRISSSGPSFPAAGTGWARGRSPPRRPEDCGRGAGGAAARVQPPALGAPLPPGPAAPRRTTGASEDPRGSAVPGHRGGDARGGDGAGRGPGQRTQPSGCWRPGLGALRAALRVTAAGPRGWRIGGGRGASPALAPSRPAPEWRWSRGRGRGLAPSRGGGGRGRDASG